MQTYLQPERNNKHEPVPVSKQSEDDTKLQTRAEANATLSNESTPVYPRWPISQPGPLATEPGKGERPVNAQRREQMVIIGDDDEEYNANG